MEPSEMRDVCTSIRRDIIDMIYRAGSGHPGSSLSSVEILAALYIGNCLNHDPKKPDWEGRDRFVLSKGHAAPALYSVLCRCGYFDQEELISLRQFGSMLQGHPNAAKTPGLDVSSGSLGQGLSIAGGMALGFLKQNRLNRVFCLLGDGEMQEGQVWEAVLTAAQQKLSNLCAIVDCNRVQLDGSVESVKNVYPLSDKFEAFGWRAVVVDGHDVEKLKEAFRVFSQGGGKPTAILADTVKGKGVSFMENDCLWHGRVPNDEEFKEAMTQLGQGATP